MSISQLLVDNNFALHINSRSVITNKFGEVPLSKILTEIYDLQDNITSIVKKQNEMQDEIHIVISIIFLTLVLSILCMIISWICCCCRKNKHKTVVHEYVDLPVQQNQMNTQQIQAESYFPQSSTMQYFQPPPYPHAQYHPVPNQTREKLPGNRS
jgi:hypothetical protein